MVDLTARLGGTLAGEHGDGRLRAAAVERTWSTVARAAFLNVKHAADPTGILNPGCKLAQHESDPFQSIRYDPELPRLPDIVQQALDSVDRDRAWHRFRLDLA